MNRDITDSDKLDHIAKNMVFHHEIDDVRETLVQIREHEEVVITSLDHIVGTLQDIKQEIIAMRSSQDRVKDSVQQQALRLTKLEQQTRAT